MLCIGRSIIHANNHTNHCYSLPIHYISANRPKTIDLNKIKLTIFPLPLSPFQQLKQSASSTDASNVKEAHNNDNGSIASTKTNNCPAVSSSSAVADPPLKNRSRGGSNPPVDKRSDVTGTTTAGGSDSDTNVLDAFIKQQHQRQRLSSGESIGPYDMSYGVATSADFDCNSTMHRFSQQHMDISQDMAAELEEDLPFIWTDTVEQSCSGGSGRTSHGLSSKSSTQSMKHQQYDSTSQYVSSNQSLEASNIVNNMLRQKGRSLNSAVSNGIY